MGVMNKLRDNTGVILWILVISFGIIWVLQDSGAFDAVGSRAAGNLIVVDGEGISIDEYQRRVDQESEFIRQQNPEAGPQELDAAADQAFEALIEGRLLEREMARLGLTVTDEEVRQMIIGEDPHPVIRMYFGDGQGGVNRASLMSFIEAPEARADLVALEVYLRDIRRQEKFQALLLSSVRVSNVEVMAEHVRRTRSVSAEVVGLRFGSIPDAEITLTENELRTFYSNNRNDFRREKTADLLIVAASKNPTRQDTVLVRNELERLRGAFASTENDSIFVRDQGSDVPFSAAFVLPNALDANVAAAIFPNPTQGQVYGPVFSGDTGYLVKVTGVRPASETFVRARHILLQAPEDNAEMRASARDQLVALQGRIQRGELSFEDAARTVSQDGSAQQGGDLGWFGRGAMVAPFEQAAFGATIGQVVGPVATQFGLHLIRVDSRASSEVQVAQIGRVVQADLSTLRAAQNQLEDIRYFAEQSGADGLRAEAERLGLRVQTQTVQVDQDVFPGIGRSNSLSRFLANATASQMSDIIELNDRYALVMVEAVTPEGFRPFEDVRAEVEARVLRDRKMTLATQRLQEALAAGFDGLAERVAGATFANVSLSQANPFVIGFGRVPQLAGAVSRRAAGQTTGLVRGEDAVFVARVSSVNEAPELSAEERTNIRQQLLNRRRQVVLNRYLQTLREQANVEDNRASLLL